MNNNNRKLAEAIFNLTIYCEAQEYRHATVLNLTRAESRFLQYFNYSKQCNGKNIADFLCVSKSRVTYLINSLLEKKLITRKANINDKRYFNLSLTDEGRKKLAKINQQITSSCSREFFAFNSDEISKFLELVNKFLKKNH